MPSDWSRVPIIASGTEVWVTVRGEKPVLSTFARADQSVLIVRTGRWQRVERMAQGDVQEIRAGPTRTRRALGLLGGVGGFFGGALAGGTVGGIGSESEELGGYVLGAMSGGGSWSGLWVQGGHPLEGGSDLPSGRRDRSEREMTCKDYGEATLT